MSNRRSAPSSPSRRPSKPSAADSLPLFNAQLAVLSPSAVPTPTLTTALAVLQSLSYPIKQLESCASGNMLMLLFTHLSEVKIKAYVVHKAISAASSAARKASLTAVESKICAFTLHLLANQKNADMTTSQTDFIVSYLTSRSLPPDHGTLRALSKVLTNFGNKVTSSEITAQEVVAPLILPLIATSPNTTPINTSSTRCAALDCISGLLKHPVQASAIFSPLVVDVRDDGSEVTVPNPLLKTLHTITKAYTHSVARWESKEVSSAARALSQATEAFSNINRSEVSPSGAPKPIKLDFSTLLQAMNTIFKSPPPPPPAKEKTHFHTLTLLVNITKHYPRQIVVLWDSFLPAPAPAPSPPMFAALAHPNLDDKERTLITTCLMLILKNMPLAAWLNTGPRARYSSSTASIFFPPRNIRNLPQRVKQSLLTMLDHTTTLLTAVNPSASLLSFCELATTLLAVIPHGQDSSAEFVAPCTKLMTTIANLFFRSSSSFHLLQACSSTFSTAANLPPITPFLKASPSFIDTLFECAKDQSRKKGRLPFYAVLAALGRTNPSCVLSGVKGAVEAGMVSEDQKTKVAALTLLEQTLAGLHDATNTTTLSPPPAAPLLIDADISCWLVTGLEDGGNDVRSCVLTACGFMTTADWSVVGVMGVVTRGSDKDKFGSEVRAHCFKMIGHYFAAVGPSSPPAVISAIVEILLANADDESFNVRTMIQFAIGNLAQNVDDALIDVDAYRQLCDTTLTGLSDMNEKVVSSAVRASGLLLRSNPNPALVATAVDNLNSKIELALNRSSNKSLEKNLNAHQRYSVNKHAWGACSALATVRTSERRSLVLLTRCLTDAENPKIRTAAVAALAEIVGDCPVEVDRSCFGGVVLACLREKDDAEIGGKCRDLLWSSLCVCTSGADLKSSIRGIIEVDNGLEFLYGFCVMKIEAGGRAEETQEDVFSVIVQALQDIDWGSTFFGEDNVEVSVGILQKFNSRASLEQRLWRNKKSPSNKESRLPVVALEDEDADEGDDEL